MNLLPITQQTCHEAAWVLAAAFVDEPVSQMIYKKMSPEKRQRNLFLDFAVELDVCVRFGYPLQICEGGKVIAAAAIYQPGAYPPPLLEQIRIFIKSIWGHEYFDLRPWLVWLAESNKTHPQKAHYFLEYLGVLPEYQGKGYGSAILRSITTKADTENVGCYLETTSPQNVPLYQRYGFKTFKEKNILGLNTWFMWREAVVETHLA